MSTQAIAVTAYEQAALVAVPPLPPPGPTQVAGRTLASLVSPGTELAWYYRGKQFPGYPGYAAVWRVTGVGAQVTKVQVGDLVFSMGGHRSDQLAEQDAVVPVPPGLAPEVAVLARLMGVSLTTVITTTARPGDRVGVCGAGPVGYLAAQMLQLCGYRVLVAEPDAQRREVAAERGLNAVPRLPVDDQAAQDFALVVDCSGHEQAVLDGCQVVRRRGEVVLVGVPWEKRTELTAHALLHAVFHRYVVLRTGWEWELPHQSSPAAPHSIFGNYETALRWLAEGRIPTAGLLRRCAPADAQTVYQDLLHHRGPELFCVFTWAAE